MEQIAEKKLELVKGKKYRVVKEGASLSGLKSSGPYSWGGWGQRLNVGDVLTYRGEMRGWGSDPGPDIHSWLDEEGREFPASFVEFQPSASGFWVTKPHPDYLEAVEG